MVATIEREVAQAYLGLLRSYELTHTTHFNKAILETCLL